MRTEQKVRALTQERLKACLSYSSETGEFIWLRSSRRIGSGLPAGYFGLGGYRLIRIDGHAYRGNRLAWLYVHGSWPEGMIDHVNGNTGDDRISNLRDVSSEVNQQNRRAAQVNSRTGVLGVSIDYNKRRPYRAAIQSNGKTIHIGYFSTIEEASSAYIAKKRQIHEGCSI